MGGAVGSDRPVQLRDGGTVFGRHASRPQRQISQEEGSSLATLSI